MSRVLITGGTGLIGRALAAELARNKHQVIVLSRNPSQVHNLPVGVRVAKWDGKTGKGWTDLASGATAIVNLAGENIGFPPIPWTPARRKRIRESRLEAGRAIVDAIESAAEKPGVLIQQSAVGYYGLCGEEVLTEEAPPGDDFLARVQRDAEASTARVDEFGIRRVITRSGVILSRDGGAIPYMSLPFRFFVGGPIGSGKQWLSWMHIADEVRAIRFLIETPTAQGVYNLAAPNPLTNAEFGRALGRVLKRPSAIPVPGFAMKLAFGELGELLLLGGQRGVPERLQQAGYQFLYPDIAGALQDLFHV